MAETAEASGAARVDHLVRVPYNAAPKVTEGRTMHRTRRPLRCPVRPAHGSSAQHDARRSCKALAIRLLAAIFLEHPEERAS